MNFIESVKTCFKKYFVLMAARDDRNIGGGYYLHSLLVLFLGLLTAFFSRIRLRVFQKVTFWGNLLRKTHRYLTFSVF